MNTKKLINKARKISATCEMHWTAIIGAVTPALDFAMLHFPMAQRYLPENIYAWGFVAILLANIVVKIRTTPADDDDGKK
jgi:hypothetical protein